MYISPYCRLAVVPLNFMKFGIRGHLIDIITCVKFLVNRFRGYGVLTPQNCHSPLTCCVALTTVYRYALPCDTVMTVFHVAPHSDRILRGSRLRILLLQFVLTDCMDEPISMKRAHFIWEFTSSANRCSVKQRRVPTQCLQHYRIAIDVGESFRCQCCCSLELTLYPSLPPSLTPSQSRSLFLSLSLSLSLWH